MKLLAPFALLLGALVLVVVLDDPSPSADLVFVNQNEVFTLDPQRMSYLQDLRLAQALYEGLVRWDNHTFQILPAAAVTVPVSRDGRTYEFQIRDDARWSNGDPVTAHDFIYSWQRAMLPDTAADYSSLFFTIDGAEAFFEWRTRQTTEFIDDPWAQPADADRRAVRGGVDRLRRLLGAGIDPAGVAMPHVSERDVIARELEAIEAALPRGRAALEVALLNATRSRTWFDALQAPRSRAAEAAWMWEQAEHRFAQTVGLAAPDDRTLRVTLQRPTAYFLDLLCFGVFFPVHRPTVEGWTIQTRGEGWHRAASPPLDERRWVRLNPATGKLEQQHEWAKPRLHVGNGPYRLAEWRYKRDLRLERSETYYDVQRVRSASVLALTIEDTNTAVLAFESGRVDWLVDVDADYQADMLAERDRYASRYRDEIDDLRAEGMTEDEALAALPAPGRGERRNIHVFPTFGTDFYSFNCRPTLSDGRRNPFSDARVRRAFARSVDKQRIVQFVTRLNEPVATTLIPPGSIPGYASPAGLSYDPDAARAELKAAGWLDRDGDGLVEDEHLVPFPVVEILYTTNVPRYKWISLDLRAQWEQQLGVRVELRGEETKFYNEDLKQGKFMIARGRWYGDYGDPTTFLDLCRSDDGNNDRKYASAYVDRLLTEASYETDPQRRLQILHEVEAKLFDEDVPLIPICQLVQVYMYEPGRVRGLSNHPRLTQFLWQMEVVDE